MKQPWEWTDETDLEALVANQTKESVNLDYKSCDALQQTEGKKAELSKDVSAFANSDGGTLVYGLVEDPLTHLPKKIDTGFDPGGPITNEWIEQVINSRIQPHVEGLRINQIELHNASPGKVAFVVYIPATTRYAHQASDKRFYKRFNFQSVPMEEYEIRDVSRRAETPELRLTAALNNSNEAQISFPQDLPNSSPVDLTLVISNGAPTPAEYAVIQIVIDSTLQFVNPPSELNQSQSALLVIGPLNVPAVSLAINWSIPGKLPIWEGQPLRLIDRPLLFTVPRDLADCQLAVFPISWRISAPRMGLRVGTIALKLAGNRFTVENEATVFFARPIRSAQP